MSKGLVILGDINLDWSDGSTKSLKAMAMKLYPLIKYSTRISKTLSSLLDLILTNQPSKYAMSGVIDAAVSDDSLIYALRKILKSTKTHGPHSVSKIPISKLAQLNTEFSTIE